MDRAGVCAPIVSGKSGKPSNFPELSPELASILDAAMLNLHYFVEGSIHRMYVLKRASLCGRGILELEYWGLRPKYA